MLNERPTFCTFPLHGSFGSGLEPRRADPLCRWITMGQERMWPSLQAAVPVSQALAARVSQDKDFASRARAELPAIYQKANFPKDSNLRTPGVAFIPQEVSHLRHALSAGSGLHHVDTTQVSPHWCVGKTVALWNHAHQHYARRLAWAYPCPLQHVCKFTSDAVQGFTMYKLEGF